MSTYIILGIYSNKGAEGLVEGESDRRDAMEKLTKSVGAKLLDYHITRGVYDFCLVTEANSFDMIAAMNLKAKAAEFGFDYSQMIRDIQEAVATGSEAEVAKVMTQYNLSRGDMPGSKYIGTAAEGGRIGYDDGGAADRLEKA